MGEFKIDGTSRPGILHMTLTGTFNVPEMNAFHQAHNAAIDALGNIDYKIFVDIRELMPLSTDASAIMEQCKHYSDTRPNFRGSAVWVKTTIVSMQHKRTSQSAGVAATELIGENEEELWEHLRNVYRTSK